MSNFKSEVFYKDLTPYRAVILNNDISVEEAEISYPVVHASMSTRYPGIENENFGKEAKIDTSLLGVRNVSMGVEEEKLGHFRMKFSFFGKDENKERFTIVTYEDFPFVLVKVGWIRVNPIPAASFIVLLDIEGNVWCIFSYEKYFLPESNVTSLLNGRFFLEKLPLPYVITGMDSIGDRAVILYDDDQIPILITSAETGLPFPAEGKVNLLQGRYRNLGFEPKAFRYPDKGPVRKIRVTPLNPFTLPSLCVLADDNTLYSDGNFLAGRAKDFDVNHDFVLLIDIDDNLWTKMYHPLYGYMIKLLGPGFSFTPRLPSRIKSARKFG